MSFAYSSLSLQILEISFFSEPPNMPRICREKFGKGRYFLLFLCSLDRSKEEKVVSDSEPQFLKGACLSLGEGGRNGVSCGKVNTLTRAVAVETGKERW